MYVECTQDENAKIDKKITILQWFECFLVSESV